MVYVPSDSAWTMNSIANQYRLNNLKDDIRLNVANAYLQIVSNMEQLKQNIGAVEAGPLPEDVTKAFEKAYHVAKCESPSYFRYYLG